jgi:hypothetical protein
MEEDIIHANMPTDQLQSKIANAFPSSLSLSHEACLEVQKQLFSAQSKDVPNLLGPVLIDLIWHHSRASTDPATDSVVRFLASANPLPLEKLSHLQIDTSQIEAFIINRQRDSNALFETFSPQQASAIRDWLLEALSWNEPHLPKDEIVAALDYWNKAR